MKKYRLSTNGSKEKNNDILKGKLTYYLSKGLSLDDACKLTNLEKKKLDILREDPKFEDFIQQSLLKNKEECLDAIIEAAKSGYWQAGAWILERKYPDEFGKKDLVRHEYEIKIKTFQKILIDVINDEDPNIRARILKRLRDYNYDGNSVMDHSFKEKKLLNMEYNIGNDEE
jgi:hypothetical protein